eukprot:CAMPEP_0198260148 /NCGR_PEP_ID=MMETSP1447-20131203/9195_1 /TAXON_ID=420782 /ORGANISM="Chaetoceros dichaeta, Strain CCMP1751" /LENGTH=69 /DNA_ID=CAMNT_0043947735 /DNA_START=74 /DNA_END=284 /DNA_ORIENTATION=-
MIEEKNLLPQPLLTDDEKTYLPVFICSSALSSHRSNRRLHTATAYKANDDDDDDDDNGKGAYTRDIASL